MGERLHDITHAVGQQMKEDHREWRQEQRTAWKSSRKWLIAAPLILVVAIVVGVLAGEIAGVSVGGVAVLVFFVGMWKHVDAGGSAFGLQYGGGD
jgi:hypothetical protein